MINQINLYYIIFLKKKIIKNTLYFIYITILKIGILSFYKYLSFFYIIIYISKLSLNNHLTRLGYASYLLV